MVEGVDDPALFAALTETAESWLRDKGMTRILGPFNLNVNQEVGLLVEGFETPPYFLMGHARDYYSRHLEACGYQGCQDMLAYLTPSDYEKPKLFHRQLKRTLREITVRPLDRKNKKAELEALREIFNDAWSDNWSYVPFTKEEFDAVGNELMLIVPEDFVMMAEHDGEPVAFIVLVPNLNEAIRDLGGKLLPFGWLKLLVAGQGQAAGDGPGAADGGQEALPQHPSRSRHRDGRDQCGTGKRAETRSRAGGNLLDSGRQRRHAQHHGADWRLRFKALPHVREATGMTLPVIVLAGERPGGNPLARALGKDAGILVEVAGKSCVERVLRRCQAASQFPAA